MAHLNATSDDTHLAENDVHSAGHDTANGHLNATSDDTHLAADDVHSAGHDTANGARHVPSDDVNFAGTDGHGHGGGYEARDHTANEAAQVPRDDVHLAESDGHHHGREWEFAENASSDSRRRRNPQAPQPNRQAAVDTLLASEDAGETFSGKRVALAESLALATRNQAAADTLLTPRGVERILANTRIAGTCRKDMRQALDVLSAANARDPNQLVHDIPGNVTWQHFIARHPDWRRIVGRGIIRAQLEFLPNVRDPNRGGQLRLDYVFETMDGELCRLHPGRKAAQDAQPIFTQQQ